MYVLVEIFEVHGKNAHIHKSIVFKTTWKVQMWKDAIVRPHKYDPASSHQKQGCYLN
jgi:hypothetical protein